MIQLNNISKSFEVKAVRIDALKDISLSIEKGEIFGVIRRFRSREKYFDPLRQPFGKTRQWSSNYRK